MPPLASRWARAILAAALAGIVVTVLRLDGVLQGPVGVVFAVVTTLAVPTAELLSRRLLLASGIVFGWVPLLWWTRLPLGSLGHGTVVLAVLACGLCAWTFGDTNPRERVRRLVPIVGWIDLTWVAALVFSSWLLWPWLKVHTAKDALSLMLPFGDNAAHFNFFLMIRSHGATVDALGTAPDGSHFYGYSYPQGFHAAAAFLDEIAVGSHVRSAPQELVGFVHASTFVFLVAPVVVIAGLCSIKLLRSRPAVLVPASALVFAAFQLGPGADSFQFGFTELVLACAMIAVAGLVATSSEGPPGAVELSAVIGAVIGTGYCWAPLLVLALPAAIALFIPRRPFARNRLDLWVKGALCGAGLLALVRLAMVLSRIGVAPVHGSAATSGVGNVATTDVGGSIVRPSVPTTVTFVVLALALAAIGVIARRRQPSTTPDVTTVRGAVVSVVPVVGLAAAGTLALVQIHSLGSVGYYFWKFTTGLELVAVVAIGIAASTLGGSFVRPMSHLMTAATCGLVALAVVQVYGPAVPSGGPGDDYRAAGIALRYDAGVLLDHNPAAAAQLLAVSAVAETMQAPCLFVPTRGSQVGGIVAQKWLLALTGRWSEIEAANAEQQRLVLDTAHVRESADNLRSVLGDQPDVTVFVTPETLAAIHPVLSDSRLTTW